MSFGLSPSGFALKTLQDILKSIQDKQHALFGATFASELAETAAGQLNGVFASELADQWLLAQSVFKSGFPSTSEGTSLDLLMEETGARRLAAAASTVTLRITGTIGLTVVAGFRAQTAVGSTFQTTADVTIGGGGTGDVAAACIVTGPVSAPSGTITQIVTPVSGVTAVTNPLDAVIGRNIETDAAARIRRSQLLRSEGLATVEAIRAKVRSVDGVSTAIVFNNPTDVTNGDGVPPHSFETVVQGGTNQDLFDAIFKAAPAGIRIYGSTTGTSLDSQGFAQPSAFTRPTQIPIYVAVTVHRDLATYPADGDAQIKAAVAAFGTSEWSVGDKVIYNRLFAPIYGISGVIEVTDLRIGTAPTPTGTTDISIGSRQVSEFDTSFITVAHS